MVISLNKRVLGCWKSDSCNCIKWPDILLMVMTQTNRTVWTEEGKKQKQTKQLLRKGTHPLLKAICSVENNEYSKTAVSTEGDDCPRRVVFHLCFVLHHVDTFYLFNAKSSSYASKSKYFSTIYIYLIIHVLPNTDSI